MNNITKTNQGLLDDIKSIINQSKNRIALKVNSEMTMLYWNIGKRIKQEILKDKRAKYGQEVVKSLAKELSSEYGKGFTYTSLIRMVQFYESFLSEQIVATVSQQLSWSHITIILPIKKKTKREFYAYMAIEEKWSVRELRSQIRKMAFERTLAYQKTELDETNLIESVKSKNSLNLESILKDPLVLDFLQLPDNHTESELEDAILSELQKFILEIGAGFSFVSRQKRMSVDGDHFYLDLLFFHRKLKRLVAIELKLGKFKPEYKGQMEFYLNWLKKHESVDGENPPIGIILCTEKSNSQIELLDIHGSNIHVAEYWTNLPSQEVFEKKVQEIVVNCRNRFEEKEKFIECKEEALIE